VVIVGLVLLAIAGIVKPTHSVLLGLMVSPKAVRGVQSGLTMVLVANKLTDLVLDFVPNHY